MSDDKPVKPVRYEDLDPEKRERFHAWLIENGYGWMLGEEEK